SLSNSWCSSLLFREKRSGIRPPHVEHRPKIQSDGSQNIFIRHPTVTGIAPVPAPGISDEYRTGGGGIGCRVRDLSLIVVPYRDHRMTPRRKTGKPPLGREGNYAGLNHLVKRCKTPKAKHRRYACSQEPLDIRKDFVAWHVVGDGIMAPVLYR